LCCSTRDGPGAQLNLMSDAGPFPIRPGVLRLDFPAASRVHAPAGAALRVEAAAEVESDNRRAATVTTADACTIMAATVVRSLEGGKAAILRPERRRNLVAAAGALGVRPFDANLLIAAVQDRVRRGEDPQGAAIAAMLSRPSGPALPMRATPVADGGPRVWRVFAAGLVLGVCLGAALIVWIMSAG